MTEQPTNARRGEYEKLLEKEKALAERANETEHFDPKEDHMSVDPMTMINMVKQRVDEIAKKTGNVTFNKNGEPEGHVYSIVDVMAHFEIATTYFDNLIAQLKSDHVQKAEFQILEKMVHTMLPYLAFCKEVNVKQMAGLADAVILYRSNNNNSKTTIDVTMLLLDMLGRLKSHDERREKEMGYSVGPRK